MRRHAAGPSPIPTQSRPERPNPTPAPFPAMANEDPVAAAASSSADGDDDEGTGTDASNSDLANPQGPPPLTDATSAPPPPPAPEPTGAVPPPPPQPQGAGAAASAEDSRRLFQRLWTDEEELLILRGFLDFTARRGTTFASHQYDTGPFYEDIRRRLSFDFTKSQLIEKLRRLKKKYRVCAARVAAQGAAFAFRSAHEGAIYDVARHIWRPAFRTGEGAAGAGDASDDDDINPAAALPAATEDSGAPATAPRGRGGRRVRRRMAQELEASALPATSALMLTDAVQDPLVLSVQNLPAAIAPPPPVQVPIVSPVGAATPSPTPMMSACGATKEAVGSILSPLLREIISSVSAAGHNGLGFGFGGLDFLGLGLGVAGPNHGMQSDEKWKQQQILELEVYLKRIELVREQVTNALQELRSSEC
ncbi:hypothetical protein BS78_03G101500 [Paspalum vaginatum]|nr:hypothetical protein BS78_03G101500 [Paspalum vaginatum]